MNRTEIDTAVRDELAVAVPDLGSAASAVDEHALFTSDLGIDSLALLELVARLEYRFGVAVPDDAFPQLTSVAAVVDHLGGALVGT